MIRFDFPNAIALAAILAAAYPIRSLADTDIPRIATVPEQVESCRSLSGAERDDCLVYLAIREEDPALCQAAPESKCAEILGTILMQRCSQFSGEERSVCEIAIAQEFATVAVCTAAADPAVCVGAVAAVRSDPQLIVDHVDDPLTRDQMLSTYAADKHDASAVALIEDNRRHDLARTFIVSSIGFGANRIVDSSYCDGMRGGYDDDADQESEQSVRELCDLAVAFSNFATARAAVVETEAEKTALIGMIEDISAAVARGEISADDLIGRARVKEPKPVSTDQQIQDRLREFSARLQHGFRCSRRQIQEPG